MNKRGFTLVELLASIVIMSLILMMAFPSIRGLMNSNDKKKYEAYERSMQEYVKAYFDDKVGIITLDSIKSVGLSGMDENCIGYVDIDDNYKAYLKCNDDYKTNGFDESKAN